MKKFKYANLYKEGYETFITFSNGLVINLINSYNGEMINEDDELSVFFWRIDDQGLLVLNLNNGKNIYFAKDENNNFILLEKKNKKYIKKETLKANIEKNIKEKEKEIEKSIKSQLKNMNSKLLMILSFFYVSVLFFIAVLEMITPIINITPYMIVIGSLVVFLLLFKPFLILSFKIYEKFYKK